MCASACGAGNHRPLRLRPYCSYGRRRRTPAPHKDHSPRAKMVDTSRKKPGSLPSAAGVGAGVGAGEVCAAADFKACRSIDAQVSQARNRTTGTQEDSWRTARSLRAANLAFLRFSTIIFCTRIALHTNPIPRPLAQHRKQMQAERWMERHARVDVAWCERLLAVNHRLGHPCVHRRAALLDRLINLTRRRLLHTSTDIHPC